MDICAERFWLICWRAEWNEVKWKWQLWLSRFWLRLRLGKWRSGIAMRECGMREEEGVHSWAMHCVVCCCWSLQLGLTNWPVWRAIAGIVAIAAGNAGQKAGCRAVSLVVCYCGQSKKEFSASLQFRGEIMTELWTSDFCCWQVVSFLATQESFESE